MDRIIAVAFVLRQNDNLLGPRRMGILATDSLEGRLALIGLACEAVPIDRLCSATTALACFPMYMVANAYVWTSGKPYEVPEPEWPGAEALLDATTTLEPAHRAVLDTLRIEARPSDRVLYEYALETLAMFLNRAGPDVADQVRLLVAQGIVKIAKFGAGANFAPARLGSGDRAYLQHIIISLHLADTPAAIETLDRLG